MKKILGISAFYHDSSATITFDDKIVAAAQEERFSRHKNTSDFPIESIKYCLKVAKISLGDLDAVVFYDKPFLKFERILETYYAFAPKGIFSFLRAIPLWLSHKFLLKKTILRELKKIDSQHISKINILFSEHHLSHAASAFFTSPYKNAAILTVDGVGEWATSSIGFGNNNSIKILKEMHFPHSVGLLYSAFTYFLGFKVNSGEYKLMGLASYGKRKSSQTIEFIQKIKETLIDIKDDGSIWMNQSYFQYCTGLKMVHDKKWEGLFGISKRDADSELTQSHSNLAFAIQSVTEEILIKMLHEVKRITQADYLCVAGGVGLNCVANTQLLQSNIFKGIYIQPAAGDAGGSIGASLAVYYMYFKGKRSSYTRKGMDIYLGPDFTKKDIEKFNISKNITPKYYEDFSQLTGFIASQIDTGKVIGWFQGKMEFGPRALGNRSILADPRNPKMQMILNVKVKKREGFRPFAPSILEEKLKEYFTTPYTSPYMLLTSKVLSALRKDLPENYENFSLKEKLFLDKSDIPAVTHVDFSSRIHSVSQDDNDRFYKLIKDFYTLTGCPILINTSFNMRGEPIVCSPEDAYKCFQNTDIDFLVMENYIYSK